MAGIWRQKALALVAAGLLFVLAVDAQSKGPCVSTEGSSCQPAGGQQQCCTSPTKMYCLANNGPAQANVGAFTGFCRKCAASGQSCASAPCCSGQQCSTTTLTCAAAPQPTNAPACLANGGGCASDKDCCTYNPAAPPQIQTGCCLASIKKCGFKPMSYPGGPASTGVCSGTTVSTSSVATTAPVIKPGTKTGGSLASVETLDNPNLGSLDAVSAVPEQTVMGAGAVTADPVFTGFDGTLFEFMGEPHAVFNVLSEKNHQFNAYFSPAVMADHNGTYLTKFGIRYHSLRLRIEVDPVDASLAVELDGQPLAMAPENKVELHMEAGHSEARMSVVWEQYRAFVGHVVEIRTPMLAFSVRSVAAGLDAGGLPQPAYLNSEASMLALPNSEMEGVLGHTFKTNVLKLIGQSVDDSPFDGERAAVAYRVASGDLFGDDFPANQYSNAAAQRKLLSSLSEPAAAAAEELDGGIFPMSAHQA